MKCFWSWFSSSWAINLLPGWNRRPSLHLATRTASAEKFEEFFQVAHYAIFAFRSRQHWHCRHRLWLWLPVGPFPASIPPSPAPSGDSAPRRRLTSLINHLGQSWAHRPPLLLRRDWGMLLQGCLKRGENENALTALESGPLEREIDRSHSPEGRKHEVCCGLV